MIIILTYNYPAFISRLKWRGFPQIYPKFVYFHFSYAETDNQQINITPKQYNTLRKLAVKRFTMID